MMKANEWYDKWKQRHKERNIEGNEDRETNTEGIDI